MKINYNFKYSTTYMRYCAYTLCDETSKGPYIFDPLKFDYCPFYAGHGKDGRPYESARPSPNWELKSEKDEKIRDISTWNVIVQPIAFFKTKREAEHMEKKLLHLIPKNYLTNAMFPYLSPDERKIRKSECIHFYLDKRKKELKRRREKIWAQLYVKTGQKRFVEKTLYRQLAVELHMQRKENILSPEIKWTQKESPCFWKDNVIFEQPFNRVIELLGVNPEIVHLYDEKIKCDNLLARLGVNPNNLKWNF